MHTGANIDQVLLPISQTSDFEQYLNRLQLDQITQLLFGQCSNQL